jgi:hypothetical protein
VKLGGSKVLQNIGIYCCATQHHNPEDLDLKLLNQFELIAEPVYSLQAVA